MGGSHTHEEGEEKEGREQGMGVRVSFAMNNTVRYTIMIVLRTNRHTNRHAPGERWVRV